LDENSIYSKVINHINSKVKKFIILIIQISELTANLLSESWPIPVSYKWSSLTNNIDLFNYKFIITLSFFHVYYSKLNNF